MALVVDSRTICAAERQAVQRDVVAVRAVDGQLTRSVAGQQIHDPRTRDGRVDGDVAVRVGDTQAVVRAADGGRRTVPYYLNRIRPCLIVHIIIGDTGVTRTVVCAGGVCRRVSFRAGNHPDCQKHNKPNLFHTNLYLQNDMLYRWSVHTRAPRTNVSSVSSV